MRRTHAHEPSPACRGTSMWRPVEQYGDALKAFDEVEKVALREKGEGDKTDVKKEAMGLQGLDKQR